jgi:hypothetical protein
MPTTKGKPAMSILKTNAELLDWIARNYRVLLAYPGNVRLTRLERSEKSDANSIARFRAALSKCLEDYGLLIQHSRRQRRL